MKFKIYLSPVDHHKSKKNEGCYDYSATITSYFSKLLLKPHISITENGRSAISQLLEHLKLQRHDEVWIVTSFDYPNVSSCVTSTIFNYCKPSRVLTNNTKLALIIHEFGMVHPDTTEIIKLCKDRRISVAEDCAHSFLSMNAEGKVTGQMADWTIVSFPKFFPVEAGGLLAGKIPLNSANGFDHTVESDLMNVADLLSETQQYAQQRVNLLKTLLERIQSLGFKSPLQDQSEGLVPWFFPIHVSKPSLYLSRLKELGVESCIWHGTDIICLPLHQYITDDEMEYMLSSLQSVN